MKEGDILGEVKTYSDPFYIFSEDQDPNTVQRLNSMIKQQ